MNPLSIATPEAEDLLTLLGRFSHLALAVSGGPDSLALMQLAARWRKARGGSPDLTVLTVDHGLRSDSRAEAELVGGMASELDLPHAILTWVREDKDATGLQERARNARYDLMAAYCHANAIPALVTAHTLDDQAETFLMRLKRGSGLDGLAAIAEQGEWSGIVIVRPLLDVPKARLVATLEAEGIPFISDPSNRDPRFERARMREGGDVLAELGLTAEAIALSARRLRRARAALDATARDFLSRHSETHEAGYAVVQRAALSAAPAEIALRALSQLIATVGGGEMPVQLGKLEALYAALQAHPDKAHTLGRCRVERAGSGLGIFREVRGTGLPVAQLHPGERTLWDDRFRVELGGAESEPVVVRALGEEGFRVMLERKALPYTLPRLAGRTLPGCWRGEVLVGLPDFGPAGIRKAPGLDCRAVFIGAQRAKPGAERYERAGR